MATKITVLFVTLCLAALVYGRPEGEAQTAESDVSKMVDDILAKMSKTFEDATKNGLPSFEEFLGDASKKFSELNAQIATKGKELTDQLRTKAKEQGWIEEKQ